MSQGNLPISLTLEKGSPSKSCFCSLSAVTTPAAERLLEVRGVWLEVFFPFSFRRIANSKSHMYIFSFHSRFLYAFLGLLTDIWDFELQLGHELMKLVLTALTRGCLCLWNKQVIITDHSH